MNEQATENSYQLVASTADVALGKTHCVTVGEKEILLCNSKKEGMYAVDNMCTHAEARLSEGKLKGCRVICPLHGVGFDIRNGEPLGKLTKIPLKTYPVKIEGDDIFIQYSD